jgi:hypothetical protein
VLDADKLLRRNVAIAFQAHGPDGGKKAREALARSPAATDAVAARATAISAKFRKGVVNSNPLINDPAGLRGWISLKIAAGYLDVAPDALRRGIERHVVRGPDGALEANIDGVREAPLWLRLRSALCEHQQRQRT